jgi:hypothetical protein
VGSRVPAVKTGGGRVRRQWGEVEAPAGRIGKEASAGWDGAPTWQGRARRELGGWAPECWRGGAGRELGG